MTNAKKLQESPRLSSSVKLRASSEENVAIITKMHITHWSLCDVHGRDEALTANNLPINQSIDKLCQHVSNTATFFVLTSFMIQ